MRGESPAFQVRVTPYFETLAGDEKTDPIGIQFRYSSSEERLLTYELDDPLGEARFTPVPRLIHRYKNRALVLVTDTCAVHCRYCFRRTFAGSGSGVVSPREIDGIIAYLADHEEIDEVLLSGGDPLTLGDDVLGKLIRVFRELRPDLVLRICTRIPGVQPSRISEKLSLILVDAKPLWVVVQFNHPRELTQDTEAAIENLTQNGLPVVSQTVLLRGVNDDPDVLAKLFRRLVRFGVKPYYLFQPDLVPGTSHFRVPLSRAAEIVDRLAKSVSRLAMPVFAVDIPGGGGKITLSKETYFRKDEGSYVLKGSDGSIGEYPDEAEIV